MYNVDECMGGRGRRDVTHRSYNEYVCVYTRRVYTDHHINIHLFTCPYSFPMYISNNRLSCEHKAKREKERKKRNGNKASMHAWFEKKMSLYSKMKRPSYFFFPTVRRLKWLVFKKAIERKRMTNFHKENFIQR